MGRRPKANLPAALSELLHEIGCNIVDLRKVKKLSQAELARRSKVSVTTLNEIEQGKRDIRVSTLVALAAVLSVPVAQLLTSSDLDLADRDQTRLLKASEEVLRIAKKARRPS